MHDTKAAPAELLAEIEESFRRFDAAIAEGNAILDKLSAQSKASLDELVEVSRKYSEMTRADAEKLSRMLRGVLAEVNR